jgi:hypothetical protein
MQWSIDLDRALRSRHPTPVNAALFAAGCF